MFGVLMHWSIKELWSGGIGRHGIGGVKIPIVLLQLVAALAQMQSREDYYQHSK